MADVIVTFGRVNSEGNLEMGRQSRTEVLTIAAGAQAVATTSSRFSLRLIVGSRSIPVLVMMRKTALLEPSDGR